MTLSLCKRILADVATESARGRITAERVLEAARELLEAEGFAALSVRRLAEALGVSRQVVYTHFGGMDGLLGALHRLGSRLLAEDVAALPARPGGDARVLAGAQAYVDAARERPALFDLVFARPVPDYVPDRQTVVASRAAFGCLVAVTTQWLAGRGGKRSSAQHVARRDREAVTLARVLWSTTHGHVVLERAGHARASETDALVRAAVRSVLRGWRDPKPRSPG
ncbi:MAG: TetR/AcrR family transcriptional regulator [Myxococcota bacterium]